MQIKVKICGLTTPEAVDATVEGGATHVGFWFSRKPRAGCVTLEQAAELASRVPRHVRKVGVFFEQDSIFFITAISAARLHIVQLHDIDPRFGYKGIEGRAAWGVLPIRTAKDLSAIARWRGSFDRIVYELKPPEGAAPERAAGLRCDWELLRGITLEQMPVGARRSIAAG
jgi:phosphoribosylanthranilate isomerase